MGETQKCYPGQKEINTGAQTTALFSFYKVLKKVNVICSNQNQVTGCLGLEWEAGPQQGMRGISRW